MAWIVTLIAINLFYSNSRLKYNDQVISSINNRKKDKLIKKRKEEREQRQLLKEKIRELETKHQAAINYYSRNKNIKRVAKKLRLGIRETRLVIKLYYRKGGESLW